MLSLPIQNNIISTVNPYPLIDELLHSHLDKLEALLIQSVRTDSTLVSKSAEYLVKAGGKRFRPMLALLFSGMTGGISPFILDLSAAIELCHTATLIHDDIIDDANVRRGIPSVNQKYGNQVAVLSGDYLYAVASQIMARNKDLSFNKLFANCVKDLVEGEIIEIEKGFQFDTTIDEYLRIINKKTAVLIALSCRFGAMVNESSTEKVAAAERYGHNLGIVFQIIDDLLDYTSSADEFGKPVLHDMVEGKITLPLIMLRDSLDLNDRNRLENILGDNIDIKDLEWILDMMHTLQITDKVREYALNIAMDGKEQLNIFLDSKYKQALIQLSEFVVSRRS